MFFFFFSQYSINDCCFVFCASLGCTRNLKPLREENVDLWGIRDARVSNLGGGRGVRRRASARAQPHDRSFNYSRPAHGTDADNDSVGGGRRVITRLILTQTRVIYRRIIMNKFFVFIHGQRCKEIRSKSRQLKHNGRSLASPGEIEPIS